MELVTIRMQIQAIYDQHIFFWRADDDADGGGGG